MGLQGIVRYTPDDAGGHLPARLQTATGTALWENLMSDTCFEKI